MRIRQKPASLVSILIALMLLVGCGGVSGAALRAEPEPGDPWLGAQCRDAVPHPPDLSEVGADSEILISVGSLSIWDQPLIRESLLVYADGTVVSVDHNQEAALTSLTAGYLPQCAVAQAKVDIAALADADFGTPGITDQSYLSMTLTDPTGSKVELSVYAPGHDEDLSRAQQNNRKRFSALLDGLRDSIIEWGPLPVDRIVIQARDGSEYAAVASAGEPWLNWDARPLSEIMNGGTCAVIHGEEAHQVAAELANNALIDVLDPDSDLLIDLAQVPPGIDGCG